MVNAAPARDDRAVPEPGPENLLDQRLEIETPERVVLVHDLAGVGSRFAAGTIDACILTVPWCGALCVAVAAVPGGNATTPEELQSVGMAFVGVCYAILWLYFLVFETTWGGRTPGKRALRLRVMSVHGGPAPFSAIVLRNVLRIVDSLPTLIPPFAGGVVMFLTRRSQRIGDLVAGTVVVRERPETLRVPFVRDATAAQGDEVSAADLAEVDRFLARRRELLAEPRADLAGRLAERMRETYALPPGNPETLLGLLGARRSPREIRDLAGPSPSSGPGQPPR